MKNQLIFWLVEAILTVAACFIVWFFKANDSVGGFVVFIGWGMLTALNTLANYNLSEPTNSTYRR